MSEVKNIPRLRFKDDNVKDFPDWEEFVLYELGNTLNGLTGKTKDDFDKGSSLYIQYKQVFGDSKIDPNGFGLVDVGENEKQTKIRYGDILFTTSSETPNEIGMSSVYMSEMDNVYLNSFCFGFRPKSIKDLIPNFSRFLFRSDKFRSSIVKLAQGSTRYNMSKTNFLKIRVRVPSNNEQQKIADFLTAVDKRIELLEKKKTLLETYKKGMIKKIFNQEIRFKDDDGNDFPDWEERKLKDLITDIIDNRGKTPPVSSEGIPLIEVNAIGKKNIDYSKIKKYVDQKTYDSWFRKHLIDNDILFSTVGQTAICSLYKEITKSCIAQNIVGLRFKIVDQKFMYYLLTEATNNNQFKRIEMGAVQPSVKVSQMIHLKFSLPNVNEQVKISHFLSSLDTQIELLDTQIDKSKTWKKGLLQKMFV